jgi:hypothetical protein
VKNLTILMGALLLILPMAAGAKTAPKVKPAPTRTYAPAVQYRCFKCGMACTAAQAKKLNYVDPMDGGKLLPVTRH